MNKSKIGITTGSAATAAATACILFLKKSKKPKIVNIDAPIGKLKIEIKSIKKISENEAEALVVKKKYPDPDVTIGLEIGARVKLINENKIIIKGGKGVGIVTKPGLPVPVGEHAINPVPRKMIKKNLKKFLEQNEGAIVTIFVPKGKEVAQKTMNPKLGIKNGISILGTKGIARPMSSKAYKKSLSYQIDVAIAQGFEELYFVPGNIGEKIALNKFKVEKDRIVQTSNFIGYMLNEASKKGVKNIVLLGHAGKLVKIAGGIFNTHSKVADARREIIAAYAALAGASKVLVKKIFKSKTTEEMIKYLEKAGIREKVFNYIAKSIKKRCEDRYPLKVKVIITDMKGRVLNSVKGV